MDYPYAHQRQSYSNEEADAGTQSLPEDQTLPTTPTNSLCAFVNCCLSAAGVLNKQAVELAEIYILLPQNIRYMLVVATESQESTETSTFNVKG